MTLAIFNSSEFRDKFIMWVNGLIIFTIDVFTIFVEILSCPLLFFGLSLFMIPATWFGSTFSR